MNKEQTVLCQKLTKTLGYSTFIKVGQRCTGKWKGITDYSLIFDGKTRLFISNGMKYFFERVEECIRQLQTFAENKEAMFQTICKQIEKDNLKAEREGLLPVECISLNLNIIPDMTSLWTYIRIEVTGYQFNFIESGTNYAILHNELEKHFEQNNTKQIFTDGGVWKPTFSLVMSVFLM